jgi:hypothetical protein
MFVTKSITTPDGSVVTHHEVMECKVVRDEDDVTLLIHSWPNEASRLNGFAEVARAQVLIPLPNLNLGLGLKMAVLSALTALTDWQGGTTYLASLPTLSGEKYRKTTLLRAERNRREFEAPLVWGGSPFDMDPVSQLRILGAALTAASAIESQQAYSETWTLADNTDRVMSASDMVSLDAARRTYVSGLAATLRQLRAQVDAATTREAVDAIVWPT